MNYFYQHSHHSQQTIARTGQRHTNTDC